MAGCSSSTASVPTDLLTESERSHPVCKKMQQPEETSAYVGSLPAQHKNVLEVVWSKIVAAVGKQRLQDSCWRSFSRASSMCTGAYTAEMGLALALRTVNESGCFDFIADIASCATWEQDSHCRQLIAEHHAWTEAVTGAGHPPPCQFTDVLGMVPLGCYQEDAGFEDKKAQVFRARTCAEQWCTRHACSCPVPFVDYDISGLPCTDNSRANARRQFSEGPTNILFIAWALRLRRFGMKMAVLENTPDLDMSMLQVLLGDMYDLFQLMVSMDDCGHSGTSRARTYIICVLRGVYTKLRDPREVYETVSETVRKCFATRPRDYFTASELEVQLEAAEVARVRQREFLPGVHFLKYLLNEREALIVESLNERYQQIYGMDPRDDKDLVYFLGDNPDFSLAWSAHSRRLPCVRRNCGKLWIPSLHRWMTGPERLASLSFPVRLTDASRLHCPAVQVLDPKRASKVAGNAMSLLTTAIVQMVALSCFRFH